ncbi:putative cytosolic protein [Roseomonas mucosa]|uniref:UPF0235 protein APZ41_010240 n=1 Tax=Roseomonas mucosa TaxID=207340 RepID=A0A1S8D4Z3_9PROT|nr:MULTISPECIES: DUF167 domain-containing protein [Roseomonas]MBS5903796.1 DUF167 domain-containing protein [Acetobacteraceae bacterium]AWV20847.1 putative cytosolic protein [Roseomonas mucosa]MCG7351188.1 DUF167 domain-containing protein [Roseomonas mucosa]MCG7357019.1 DUF167 domain-containing protein [Roseomonas mucosa]MDT8291738.1 DUF167 domain-containing protein [Roseomonas mucosa]
MSGGRTLFPLAWRVVPEGLELRVRAQPKARRPGITGVVEGADGPRLRVAVSPAPEDGRATRAVVEALAEALRVPPSAITLLAGAASREKTFRIQGEAEGLAAVLEQWA